MLATATTSDLIREIWQPFSEEARAVCDLANRHCQSIRAKSVIRAECFDSISTEDCILLCLLIRHFNRKSVFEIGTYVGTSAVCMNDAVRRNGGVLTTSDPFDYAGIPPWSGIRFIQQPASIALQILRSEEHAIDFYFIDWLPDEATIQLIKQTATPDAIFAVHDWRTDKGCDAVEALNRSGLCADKRWFLPKESAEIMPDGMRINACTAFCLPDQVIS